MDSPKVSYAFPKLDETKPFEVIEGAVKRSHGRKTAFKAAIGRAVLALVHKHNSIFKAYYREIFYEGNVEAGLKVSGNIALAVTEVRRYLCGSDTAFEVFVYVEE